MELNSIATGIDFLGATIKNITVKNGIVDVEKTAKRSFGLNINEPCFKREKNGYYSEVIVDFKVEGAFLSSGDVDEDMFEQLVGINGVAAIIGIARGKIEAISANIFNNGKIVIPFVNVIDYYKSM